MFGIIKDIRVSGVSAAVPPYVEDNMERYADILGERRCKKQIRLTGIERRHLSAHDQRSSDLAAEAARYLMEREGWKPEEIRVLIYVTQKPDFHSPSTAFRIQKLLGISHECTAFDVNLGCSAAQVGIQIAAAVLAQLEEGAKGLVLCGYAVNIDEEGKKPEDQMLFGSAGGAVGLIHESEAEEIPYLIKSDGSRYHAIFRDTENHFSMDGEAVFSFSIGDVVNDVQAFKEHFGISEESVDYYAFHQPQKLILDTMMNSLNVPPEKALTSLREYGNTSGASALVTLCANTQALQAIGGTASILTCGFGGGLSWCALKLVIDVAHIYPIISTNHVLDDNEII